MLSFRFLQAKHCNDKEITTALKLRVKHQTLPHFLRGRKFLINMYVAFISVIFACKAVTLVLHLLSEENTSINSVGNCGPQCTFNNRDTHAFMWCMSKNRGAAVSAQVTGNVSAGCDQTVCKNSLLNFTLEGNFSRVALHKCLITKINAHLTVHCCKNHGLWSTEM